MTQALQIAAIGFSITALVLGGVALHKTHNDSDTSPPGLSTTLGSNIGLYNCPIVPGVPAPNVGAPCGWVAAAGEYPQCEGTVGYTSLTDYPVYFANLIFCGSQHLENCTTAKDTFGHGCETTLRCCPHDSIDICDGSFVDRDPGYYGTVYSDSNIFKCGDIAQHT